jgi:hypothetical protein
MMVGLKTLASALAALFATGRTGEADHHGGSPSRALSTMRCVVRPRKRVVARNARAARLVVWSRDEVVRVDREWGGVFGPGITDRLEGCSPSQGL